jgi:hypothetical protein
MLSTGSLLANEITYKNVKSNYFLLLSTRIFKGSFRQCCQGAETSAAKHKRGLETIFDRESTKKSKIGQCYVGAEFFPSGRILW